MSFYNKKKAVFYRFAFVTACAICLACAAGQGAIVTVEITGEITIVHDPGYVLGGQIEVGDTFSGWYKYSSHVVDTNPSASEGEYTFQSLPCGISLNIGELLFASRPEDVDFLVKLNNDYLSEDRYSIVSGSNLALSNGAEVSRIFWQLKDGSQTALSSDKLPLEGPVLSDWTSNILSIDGAMHISAQITDVQFTVIPEPTSVFLLLSGAGLFIRRKNS